ncbi:MAG TPA: hypothetical protein PKM88_08325 [bacterium]|nr:hypothetical protein [bacterium]
MDYDALQAQALAIFGLGLNSVHGPDHWRRVDECACRLAPATGADLTVCRLFALGHDVCRNDDGEDRDHGRRAAAWLRTLAMLQGALDARQIEQLLAAVAGHTDGTVTGDPTIGTCWDADRLDLGRVGIIPAPQFMSTAAGKMLARSGVAGMPAAPPLRPAPPDGHLPCG